MRIGSEAGHSNEMCPDVPVGPVLVLLLVEVQVVSGPGPVKSAWMYEDRRCESLRSTASGSPVALLASLGFLNADGDGVDEPELEQNSSRLQRFGEPKRTRHMHT